MDFLYDRTIDKGQKVKVYVNLHQQGKFSVVDMKTGLVCGYATSVLLQDAHFHVGEGRLDVIKTRQKKVHAWVRGIFLGDNMERPVELAEEVNYNPYVHVGFTDNKGVIITYTSLAYLTNKKVYIK